MAHELKTDTATPAVLKNASLDTPEITEARRDLAACFRMAAKLDLQEGICNHFSAVVPGHSDLFLVNPYGWAFAEIRASQLLICDFNGNVVAGEGKPEATAFYIHAQIHKVMPRASAAFHTHMPNATALSMIEGHPFVWAGQTSLKFYGRTAVDENYNGLALGYDEGLRIARRLVMPTLFLCGTMASWCLVQRSPKHSTIVLLGARCRSPAKSNGKWPRSRSHSA